MTSPEPPQLELYQAEWCPFSHQVRRRLTQLGISYISHQAVPDRAKRDNVIAASGQPGIPVLITPDGPLSESGAIIAYLNANYSAPEEVIQSHIDKELADWQGWVNEREAFVKQQSGA